MNTSSAHAAEPPNTQHTPTVRVNHESVMLNDYSPTGEQILAAAGLVPTVDFALLHWPSHGPTNEIGLQDVIDLPREGAPLEFFAIRTDGISYFTLDEVRFAWAGLLDEATLRRIGRVAENKQIWFERTDHPDRQLQPGEQLHLEREGVERFYTQENVWTLEVQGEPTAWAQPLVLVRDAIVKAGFDPSKPWVLMFKVKNEPIRPVELTDTLDLSKPGIERLRVRPKHVKNGDGQNAPRRDFSLLPKDAAFLDGAGYRWQSISEGRHRWLVVENYDLPAGYSVASCRLAIEMPVDYPTAQLDMFYCDPILTVNGAQPDRTDARATIDRTAFQRWSRHREVQNVWSPTSDNLSTHFALIEHAIGREVGA